MLLKTYEQTFPASASISYFGRQLIFKAAKNVDVVVVSWSVLSVVSVHGGGLRQRASPRGPGRGKNALPNASDTRLWPSLLIMKMFP